MTATGYKTIIGEAREMAKGSSLLILQGLYENIGNYTQEFYVFFPHLLFSALSL